MRVDDVRDGVAFCGNNEVMIDLVDDVRVGDELLVHAGVALARVA